MDYRATQKKKLDANPSFTISDVTTVNLTKIFVSKKFLIPCLLYAHVHFKEWFLKVTGVTDINNN